MRRALGQPLLPTSALLLNQLQGCGSRATEASAAA